MSITCAMPLIASPRTHPRPHTQVSVHESGQCPPPPSIHRRRHAPRHTPPAPPLMAIMCQVRIEFLKHEAQEEKNYEVSHDLFARLPQILLTPIRRQMFIRWVGRLMPCHFCCQTGATCQTSPAPSPAIVIDCSHATPRVPFGLCLATKFIHHRVVSTSELGGESTSFSHRALHPVVHLVHMIGTNYR